MHKNKMNGMELEEAILFIKENFTKTLEVNLNLIKISSPLFLDKKTGLNDHLNNDGQPVTFKYKEDEFEVVQSLAK